MLISKVVTVEQEVKINVSFAEMVEEMTADATNTKAMLAGLNTCLSFVKSLPGDLLSTLTEAQRDIVVNVMTEQVTRIKGITLQTPPATENIPQ